MSDSSSLSDLSANGTMRVEFQLFGAFSLRVDAQPSPKIPKSCQQLFALLLLGGRAGIHRDRAAQTLWQDVPAETARFYLRRTLTGCREALGSQRECLQSVEPDIIRLAHGAVKADLLEFEARCNADSIDDLRRAFEISQAEFLPGSKSGWVAVERMRILLRSQEACLKCAQLLRKQGNFSEALEVLALSNRRDPLDEAAIVPYWECLVETGQEAQFQESYRRTIERYTKLGLELTPRLIDCSKRLFRASSLKAEPATAFGEVANAPYSLEGAIPLIGREAELKTVLNLLKLNRIVELNGAPGAGKTRCALEIARRLGWPAVYVTSDGLTSHVADRKRRSLLIVEVAGTLPNRFADGLQTVLAGSPFLRVLVLSPSHDAVGPAPSVQLVPIQENDAVRLFRAMMGDDSVDGTELPELVRRLDGNPSAIAIVADHARKFGMADAKLRLQNHDASDQLVSKLVRHVVSPWMESLDAQERTALLAIARLPESIPFGLALHLLKARDQLIMQKLVPLAIATVEPAGRLRVSHLVRLTAGFSESETKQAQIGDYFDQPHLLSNQPLEEDLPILEEVIDAGGGNAPGSALRLLNWIGPELARQGRSDRLDPLTRKVLQEIEPSGDVAQAWLNLGSAFHVGHDLLGADEAYRTAFEIAGAVGSVSRQQHALLYRGEVASHSGDLALAEACSREALAMPGAKMDRMNVARALRNLGYIKRQHREFDAAIEYTTKALALYTFLGDMEGRLWSIGSLGSCLLEAGQWEASRARFLEALELHRVQNNPFGMAWNLTCLADASNRISDFVSAIAYGQEALEIQEKLESEHGRAWPLRVLSETAVLQGDYDKAEKLLHDSLNAVRSSGSEAAEAQTLISLSRIELKRNDRATAKAYLELAEEIGTRLDNSGILHKVESVRADFS